MILVTGGAGYIGSHAVKLLLEKGFKVTVIDNLFRGYREAIEVLQKEFGENKLRFYQVDLMDREGVNRVFDEVKPEVVFHFAALCLVNESIGKPDLYFRNNILGSLNLLEAMRMTGCGYLVFSSTAAVYEEGENVPVDEKSPLGPLSPYGESKLLIERIIKSIGKVRNLKYVILRYFNVTGAANDGLVGDSKKPSQLLVQNTVRGALGIEPFSLTCSKVDTRDGTPVRDFINVEDLVEAHLQSLIYLKEGGKSNLFNLGTGYGNSVLEIVNKVKEITGIDFEVGISSDVRKGEIKEICADISKVKKVLGWKPRRTIKDSVRSLVKWYKNRPSGWDY